MSFQLRDSSMVEQPAVVKRSRQRQLWRELSGITVKAKSCEMIR
jgi:hypothetical protein